MWITSVLSALAMVVSSHAAQPEKPRAPFWCEDLGLACSAGAFNDKLLSADPHEFLPKQVAEFALDCQRAREAGDMARVTALKLTSNPLAGAFDDVFFVPKSWVGFAALPASGARLVADCTGKHLQLVSSPGVLKRALADVLALSRESHYAQLRGHGISRWNSRVSVISCDIGTGYVRRAESVCQTSTWTFRPDGRLMVEAAFVPSGFVSKSCFPGGPRR